MRLLDTNICIYIINRQPPAVLGRFIDYRPGELAVSFVTAAELRFGASKSTRAEKSHAALDLFLGPLDVLPMNERVARVYGDLRANLERSGRPIGPLDTLIAAHALALDAIVVTNNVREFERVPGLSVENWVD